MVIFFRIFEINNLFCFFVAMGCLVHDVEAIHDLIMLTANSI